MIKLSLFSNERIIIENYKCLKEINDDYIIVDEYNIFGNNLKIKIMNKYMIDIFGVVRKIEVSN